MPLTTGSVTFCRFRVAGDAPPTVDDTFLQLLYEHRFRETEIGSPDEVEAGFVTPEHIFDTKFSYEKCGYGQAGLFALRVDTHKVPGEIKKAYQRVNEQAMIEGNATGFASKSQKREARELADRQVQEDLAAGRFRKSKHIRVMWDFKGGVIYCESCTDAVVQQLVRLMRSAFSVQLDPITSGTLAGHWLGERGRTRDYEDLTPSKFTKPPADTADRGDEVDHSTPICPWVAKSIDLKDFLGNEFLLWLWYACEQCEGIVGIGEDAEAYTAITKSIQMDCAWEIGGKVTINVDKPTALAESGDALRTGKWPRKMGLLLTDGERHYELTLQGDLLVVSGAHLPDIEDAQTDREVIEHRLRLIRGLTYLLDAMYLAFLKQRTSGWVGGVAEIRDWIKNRQ